MLHCMLKAKLHQARVTHSVTEQEGSCAIDGNLLDMAGLGEYEQVHIYNLESGKRFITYIVRGEEGSNTISISGADAHKTRVGDRIIICAYGYLKDKDLEGFKPRMLYLNADNTVSHTSNSVPVKTS